MEKLAQSILNHLIFLLAYSFIKISHLTGSNNRDRKFGEKTGRTRI